MIRGEVYWVEFGRSCGGEITKTRPAMIITADGAGRHLNRLQVVPFTSNVERVFLGEALTTVNGQQSKALATQLTTASKERFRERIGVVSVADVARIEVAIRILLGLP